MSLLSFAVLYSCGTLSLTFLHSNFTTSFSGETFEKVQNKISTNEIPIHEFPIEIQVIRDSKIKSLIQARFCQLHVRLQARGVRW